MKLKSLSLLSRRLHQIRAHFYRFLLKRCPQDMLASCHNFQHPQSRDHFEPSTASNISRSVCFSSGEKSDGLDFRDFLLIYPFEGERWFFRIKARSDEEAEGRFYAIKEATFLFPLQLPKAIVRVVTISCIDADGRIISKISINEKTMRPYIVETALNRMVDDINKHPSSLVGKAFRVRAERFCPAI